MTKLRLGIMGATGRMGRALINAAHTNENVEIVAALEKKGAAEIGEDIGALVAAEPMGVKVTDDPLELFTRIDAALDFTAPSATIEYAEYAAQARIIHVIGTTGMSDDDVTKLNAAARHATIIKAGNMSLGVNLLAALTRKVATILDEKFDIEIVEMHHRHKVDAPSGTSLMLGDAAADGRQVSLSDKSVRVRDGVTGPRKSGDIGFASLRGGTVAGDHTVIFAGDGERIELTHKADDRGIFAKGAISAALWGHGKGPGLYSMADVLDLN